VRDVVLKGNLPDHATFSLLTGFTIAMRGKTDVKGNEGARRCALALSFICK